jgi:uncharacterized protein with GYD domain
MNFNYTDSSVRQGRENQNRASESPNTFATQSGADDVRQTTRLDKPNQRMAGQMGNRLKEYMSNPEEQARTDNWMATFELSNEGKKFNEAKMGGAPQA